jgi:hypothetical protein
MLRQDLFWVTTLVGLEPPVPPRGQGIKKVADRHGSSCPDHDLVGALARVETVGVGLESMVEPDD